MKKIAALILCATLSFSALCAKENLFSFSAGLSSGFPIYGSNSVLSTGSEIENGNRVIIGTNLSANLNIVKQVSFFIGNDILWDLTWSPSEKSNKMHVTFPLGLKVYPGLGGLNLGLAYTLGFRSDNFNTKKLKDKNVMSPWGNGFKF